MIQSLAPLGGTHTIHLILDYSGADVTVTAILKPKKEGQGKPHTLNISGPIIEVNDKLGTTLAEAVGKISEFNHNLANIDAEIKAAEAEKKKSLEAAKTAAKPKAAEKPAPAATKATPAAETKGPTVERTLPRPTPPAPAKAPAVTPPPPAPAPAATPAAATVAGVDKPVALVPATTVIKPPAQETISLGGAEDLGL